MTAPRAVGVIVIGMLALAGCSTDEAPTRITPVSEAPETPAATASPTADKNQDDGKEFNEAETAAIENAKNAVVKFYDAREAAFHDPKNAGEEPFSTVAIDPVRSSEQSLLEQFQARGWHMTGESIVKLRRVQSVKTKSDPENFVYPEVFLEVCIDRSSVDVLDESGTSIKANKDVKWSFSRISAYEEPNEGWFVQHVDSEPGGDKCSK